MKFLCRQQREAVPQVKAHLVAEDGERPGSGAVTFLYSFREDAVEEVEVLLHISLYDYVLSVRTAGASGTWLLFIRHSCG